MGNPQKKKGSVYEREIVNQAKDSGLIATRAYASNGMSLGEAENVDVVIANGTHKYRLQAKRRKKLGELLRPAENIDAQVVREDRGESFVVIRFTDWLRMVKGDNIEIFN
jgi:Holliday junction resolvase